jgi:hypothetical protein
MNKSEDPAVIILSEFERAMLRRELRNAPEPNDKLRALAKRHALEVESRA